VHGPPFPEADGFDVSDTLTVPNGDNDLPVGEAFTEPSAQISQGAAYVCESRSEVEVRPHMPTLPATGKDVQFVGIAPYGRRGVACRRGA
jgi:hypothetical protein